jgi:GTPase SAR1 family protein
MDNQIDCNELVDKEILLLGPDGSGKSLLVKRIVELNDNKSMLNNISIGSPSFHNLTGTTPTTGTDLSSIILLKNDNEHKLIIREVGGIMVNRWSSYLTECNMLLYVIDASDQGKLADAIALLNYDIIGNDEFNNIKKQIPIAIVLNKTDLIDQASLNIMKNLLDFESLKLKIKLCDNVELFEGNCMNNDLPYEIIQWLKILLQ